MAELILLNGMPGIGKSTIAARYVGEHAGVLNCDIDVLRTLVGGWQDDYNGAGGRIRSAALALATAYLRGGDDASSPSSLLGSLRWSGSSERPSRRTPASSRCC